MRGILSATMLVALATPAPAQELLEQQRRDQARRHYEAGSELMLGESFEEAVKEFRTATGLDPEFVLAHFGLGQALMASKRYPEAVQAYTSCRDVILRGAALDQRTRAEQDRRRRDDIQEMEQSLVRLRTGQIKSAAASQEILLEQRINVMKDDQMRGAEQVPRVPAELSLALGSAHFRLGQLEDAEREYRAAIKVDKKLGAAHNNLAVICMKTGRLDEAQRELELAEKSGFAVHPQFKDDLKRLKQADGKDKS